MDIARLSMALSQGQVQQQASMSLMRKAMDQAEGNAEFINNMMGDKSINNQHHATHPHKGGNIDLKA